LTEHEDIVKVRLKFKNGAMADISASRLTFMPYRKARIFQRDSYISLDFAKPSLKIYRKEKNTVANLSDLHIIKPRLKKIEPLRNELEHFLLCCATGVAPLVEGVHGRNALELAWEILKITNKQISK
jgi:predicted dehydrogenase